MSPRLQPNRLRHIEEEKHTMSEEGFTAVPFIRPPDEITLIPQSFGFCYMGHRDGQDAFALRVADRAVGEVALMLTEGGAMHVAEHLLAMVRDQDELRAEYDARNLHLEENNE
jgi:hypothetical protein